MTKIFKNHKKTLCNITASSTKILLETVLAPTSIGC